MRYYPIYVDLHGRKCLVVGGGAVARQKVKTLVEAKARVTVVSPRLVSRLRAMVKGKKINYFSRKYRKGDLKGYFLAYDATGDSAVHRLIAQEARAAGVLLNVVDQPDWCNFIAPALVKRGDLTIAVSTSGASPALAKKVRQELELSFGAEYNKVLRLLSALRSGLRRTSLSPAARRRILTELARSDLLEYVKRRRKIDVERLLSRVAGRGWNLHRLGVTL